MISELGDGQLVRRCRAGDEHAADELVRRHYRGAWRAAFAVTGTEDRADDAAQDAFERALRRLRQYDPSQPFAPWIGRIAVNCAIDQMRRHGKEVPAGDALRDEPTGRSHSRDTRERMHLMEALDGLNVDHRAVVVLRLYLGYSADETAKILNVEAGTVHSRLSRAKAHLRAAMGGAP